MRSAASKLSKCACTRNPIILALPQFHLAQMLRHYSNHISINSIRRGMQVCRALCRMHRPLTFHSVRTTNSAHLSKPIILTTRQATIHCPTFHRTINPKITPSVEQAFIPAMHRHIRRTINHPAPIPTIHRSIHPTIPRAPTPITYRSIRRTIRPALIPTIIWDMAMHRAIHSGCSIPRACRAPFPPIPAMHTSPLHIRHMRTPFTAPAKRTLTKPKRAAGDHSKS